MRTCLPRLVTGHMAEIWVAVPVIIAGALLAMMPLAWAGEGTNYVPRVAANCIPKVRAGDDGCRAIPLLEGVSC